MLEHTSILRLVYKDNSLNTLCLIVSKQEWQHIKNEVQDIRWSDEYWQEYHIISKLNKESLFQKLEIGL